MTQKLSQKDAGLFTSQDDIVVSDASLAPELTKVWTDEDQGQIAVSVDRLVFDSIPDIAARYLEPNGFSLNLENILAVIDSMRIAVFAGVSSRQVSNMNVAKKILPAVYMQLPRKSDVGSILKKFYSEIGRYEAELGRLQDAELRARKVADSSIKDESVKKIVDSLQTENLSLRADLERLQRKLAAAESQVQASLQMQDPTVINGLKEYVVRSVRIQEGAVLFKADDTQFSYPLKDVGGTPVVGAKAIGFHGGRNTPAVWVYNPPPTPFIERLATAVAVDGRKVKLRFDSRAERLVTVASDQAIPTRNAKILGRFSGEHLVTLSLVSADGSTRIADLVFEEQTKRQLDETIDQEAS